VYKISLDGKLGVLARRETTQEFGWIMKSRARRKKSTWELLTGVWQKLVLHPKKIGLFQSRTYRI